MQLETGNNVNNYQLSIRLILREPGVQLHVDVQLVIRTSISGWRVNKSGFVCARLRLVFRSAC